MGAVSLFLVIFVFIRLGKCQYFGQPEQIHLSYGDNDPTQMVVTWVTLDSTNISIVEYGYGDDFGFKVNGEHDTFEDGGSEKRKLYMHRVTLQNLKPGQKYVYHVGSPQGWSDSYSFTAMRDDPDWAPVLAIYGDMGNDVAKSMAVLQDSAQQGLFDAVLHVGDFAYNLDSANAKTGDAFMNQIQSIAAYVPYMTCPGNHEYAYNFSNYKSRFTMPNAGGDGQNMFYSFNMGPAHIISFTTEFYYYPELGWAQIVNQYDWLVKDLQIANSPENRSKRPWIIVMGHRPMYCSNSDDHINCNNKDNLVRVGIQVDIGETFGLEDLFYKYGVDVQFYAHEHSYERLLPVYNRTVCKGSEKEPYTNPNAPVHIVTGSAGNHEGQDPFIPVGYPWSAFHSDDFGYTSMTLSNATHLKIEQISINKNATVIDSITVVKDNHGMGKYNCH